MLLDYVIPDYRDFKNAQYLFVHGVLPVSSTITARGGVPRHSGVCRVVRFSTRHPAMLRFLRLIVPISEQTALSYVLVTGGVIAVTWLPASKGYYEVQREQRSYENEERATSCEAMQAYPKGNALLALGLAITLWMVPTPSYPGCVSHLPSTTVTTPAPPTPITPVPPPVVTPPAPAPAPPPVSYPDPCGGCGGYYDSCDWCCGC